MTDAEERRAFWGRCIPCGHTWAVAYMPMEARAFCRATKRACCPMCGSTKIAVPKQDNGVLQEGVPT